MVTCFVGRPVVAHRSLLDLMNAHAAHYVVGEYMMDQTPQGNSFDCGSAILDVRGVQRPAAMVRRIERAVRLAVKNAEDRAAALGSELCRIHRVLIGPESWRPIVLVQYSYMASMVL